MTRNIFDFAACHRRRRRGGAAADVAHETPRSRRPAPPAADQESRHHSKKEASRGTSPDRLLLFAFAFHEIVKSFSHDRAGRRAGCRCCRFDPFGIVPAEPAPQCRHVLPIPFVVTCFLFLGNSQAVLPPFFMLYYIHRRHGCIVSNCTNQHGSILCNLPA